MIFHAIITFVSGKGWFFAKNLDDQSAIFIHQKDVENMRYLRVGDRVTGELAPNPRSPGKTMGTNVKFAGRAIARQVSDPTTGGAL
jgi:cold shock CspA family protein